MRKGSVGGRGVEAHAVIAVATVAVTFGVILTPATARAQQCTPSDYPATWSGVSWTAYTSLDVGIEDEVKGPDGSYGTPPEPDLVDIYNGDNGDLPSLYWSFDAGDPGVDTDGVFFFRQRIQGDPRQAGDTDNYKQFTWTSNFDLDGDGFSDFLVQVNGFDDTVQVMYDADGDNVFDDRSCAAGGDIVFEVASGDGDAGTIDPTELTDDSSSGNGYTLDWQLPLCAFTDCAGTQILTETTPFSLTFTTSTNQGNPALKDGGFPGDYKTAGDRPLPGGDPCSLDGTCTQRPYIGDRSATCNGSPTTTSVDLVAMTLDTLVVDNTGCTDKDGCVVDTIDNVKFEYKEMGTADPWTEITTLTAPDTDTLNSWSTTWDVTGLDPTAEYWVRITVTDDDGNANSFDPNNDGDVTGQFAVDLSMLNQDCAGTPLPVSLAWVHSEVDGDRTHIRWATATEAGNLGFHLYGLDNGRWRRLNLELVPSTAVDSMEPLQYQLEVAGSFDQVTVEDVDIHGRSHQRGPFAVGHSFGGEPSFEPVDWRRVQRELREARVMNKSAGSAPTSLELLVDRDGIYRVSYEQLAAAGLDLTGVPPAEIALTNRGGAVPITPLRTTSGPAYRTLGFGPGWSVEFYGEALDDLYTSTNIYRLTLDEGLARRAGPRRPVSRWRDTAVATRYMETLYVERDLGYSFSAPNGDPWYDTRMLAYTEPERWSFDLEVDHLVSKATKTTLMVDLWGWTDFELDPDHHVRVSLNGQPVADELFDGSGQLKLRIPLPEGLLVEGTNTLEVELPGDTGAPYDLVALDRIGVSYPRWTVARDGRLTFRSGGSAIEVTGLPDGPVVAYRLGSDGPVRLQTRRVGDGVRFAANRRQAEYVVSGEDHLLSPRLEPVRPATDITGGSAEYLIISHPHFLAGLGELISAREADGLGVRLVNVEDVYDQFNHGVFGARGIAEYVRHAAANMDTRLVLLVGGDTYDYHDHLGLGSVSFIPSPYLATHQVVQYAPVDPAYGDCDGDRVPEVAVGRLPVRTREELDAVVAKILWYESKAYPQTAVFAADREDGEVSFADFSDGLIATLDSVWAVDRAYLDELDRDGARQVITDTVNGGVALTSFVGHSGLTMWSFDRLFETGDAVDLTNHGWPTVVVQWGCWNTYHASPRVTTLGEAFMTTGDQGAAAVLGAATLTDVTSDRALSEALLPLLVTPGVTIGEAMVEAKREVADQNPQALDVLLGWTLLGDPAMRVDPP
jgi:hypothetical protein